MAMKKLHEVVAILNGDRSSNYPSGDDFITFGQPFVNAGHLQDRKVCYQKMDYISEAKLKSLSGAKLRKNDILLCLRGTLGKYAYVEKDGGAPASSLAVLRANESILPSYLFHLLGSHSFQSQIETENNGSSQPNLSAKSVGEFMVPVPPVSVQADISNALSEMDAMISILERKIAKKKGIKQGTMQELLTGKKRLPGYKGQWDVRLLGDVALDIKTGTRNNEEKSTGGKYPFFVRSQQVERIENFSYDCEAILVPGEGNIGQIFHYYCGKFDCHQRVYKISDFKDVDGKFVFYYLKAFFGKYALANTVKATVDSLRLPTFINFPMQIPVEKDEQTAIAKILSNMDSEIESLEQKLAKARQLKQGMMQQLLTGKIRLV